MTRRALVLFVFLLAASELQGQAPSRRPRRETWYEQALKRINPDNTDYGAMWEERKRAFMDQLENPYFQYICAATAALAFWMTVTFVQHVSHTRELDIAAQSLADALRHDEDSRQVAREAIRSYNDHIEACNRAFEARDDALSQTASATEAQLKELQDQLAAMREENTSLRNDLAKRPGLGAVIPARPAAGEEQPPRTQPASQPAQHMARINELEKKVREEQRRNQRLKGTSVDDHRD